VNYEEKMAKLRVKSEHEEAAKALQARQRQQRQVGATRPKVLSLSQINRMLDKTEQKIQRRAKRWESKGYLQPAEVAKPDPPETSN
jgi:transposase